MNLKSWFPFTDYDFYGYLSCGIVLLFIIDYWLTGGIYMVNAKWTVQQGAFATAIAYVAGQIIAIPSSIILEHGFARKLLRPPILVQMSKKVGIIERFIGSCIVGRYYTPLPESTRKKVLERAVIDTGLTEAKLLANMDNIFHPAFSSCQSYDSSKTRIDDFRNQYGFNRNMALIGFVSAGLLMHSIWYTDSNDAIWAILSLIMGIGMLIRFLKFYAAFSAEILRTYAFGNRNK